MAAWSRNSTPVTSQIPLFASRPRFRENPSVLRQLIMYTHWAQTSICSSTVRMNSAL